MISCGVPDNLCYNRGVCKKYCFVNIKCGNGRICYITVGGPWTNQIVIEKKITYSDKLEFYDFSISWALLRLVHIRNLFMNQLTIFTYCWRPLILDVGVGLIKSQQVTCRFATLLEVFYATYFMNFQIKIHYSCDSSRWP